MKQAIEWIEEQSANPPRAGSLEMKSMLEAVQAIQRGCTANPNRHCKMCVLLKHRQPTTDNLTSMAMSLSPGDDKALERYREFCGGCPACMLTGVRQAYSNAASYSDRICTFDFDFKDELKRFWSERDEEQRRQEEFATY